MKRLKKHLFMMIAVTGLLFVSCNQEVVEVTPSQEENIYEALASFDEEIKYYGYPAIENSSEVERRGRGKGMWMSDRPTFKTLTVALAKTKLISTVVRANITVFAPTDKAFAELGLNPTNIGDVPNLKEILLYHVIGDKVYSSDLNFGCFPTLSGEEVRVDLTDGVFINDAQVIKPDVKAFNGVFHIIDKVIFPPDKNIVELAMRNPDFSILVDAVTRVGLGGALSGDDNLTVFAPTNDAFVALLSELGYSSLDEIDDETLTAVLLYHVVDGKICSNELTDEQMVPTLNGDSFTVDLDNLTLTDVNGRESNLVLPLLNLQATNGVVHVIERVLLPTL
ncbi:fasciclin domain-containing protein [Mangrovivirga sp. M17]|uniref:Fasciclin domain-containing protein n=1 Tax=Mangrovivirga halotolerans TaxID=2993936 RepID=A0ABT3RND2_9BACT|nr:fasciclin domain-containing protein [Mangrovivirga halotolerans]MCX2743312.1 fasciclin domain-containing protein [Mangrovivirga halotolerans]